MQASDASRDALLVELELHKAEFAALRTEILQWLDSERQYLNMSLVAIVAGFGAAPFVVERQAFVLFLLYPVVFHVLLWEMLASTRIIGQLSSYLVDNVISRVNKILDELGDDRRGTTVLGWEVRVKTRLLKTPDWLIASFAPARHWVPILAIGVLLVFYLAATQSYGYTPSHEEFVLILVSLLFLLLAAVRNIVVIRSAVQETHRLRSQTGSVTVSEHQPSKKKSASTQSER